MDKDEMKNRISLALKDPILQQGFEIICKKNAELEEKISVLLSCTNCPENKGGLICQKEYEGKCLAQKIQYIKELKEENAKLKKQLRMSNKVYNDNLDYSHHIEGQLTNAKEIISEYVRLANLEKEDTVAVWQLYHKAEQFLNSEVEK